MTEKKAGKPGHEIEASDETPAPKIEKAFTHSGAAELFGITLQPYSPDRVIAAQGMGMRYGFLDKEELDTYRQKGIYPGMLSDVINHIWIRSLVDPDRIDIAIRSPQWARREAQELAVRHDYLDVTQPNFAEAADLFLGEMKAISDSRTEAKKKASAAQPVRTS